MFRAQREIIVSTPIFLSIIRGIFIMFENTYYLTNPYFFIFIFIFVSAHPTAVFGFARLQAYCFNSCGLHDTCGVLNLHGMPGLIGGAVSGTIPAIRNGAIIIQQY